MAERKQKNLESGGRKSVNFNPMKLILPKNVKRIITRLNEAGFLAYAVGGCVRDSILNRKPKDWDITTYALPAEVKSIFKKTIDTGIKHGEVVAFCNFTFLKINI